MNRKRKLFRALSVIVCVVLMFELFSSMRADAEESVQYVHDSRSLISAIATAKDGDIIVFDGMITISENVGSLEKTVTLRRDNGNSYLNANYGINIQGIIFDGKNLETNYPILITNGDFKAENCTFQNCGSPEFWGGAGAIGGAVQVNGSASFVGCDFYNNTSTLGGHIAIRSGSTNIENCTFKNGRGVSEGGAISIFANSNCYIDSCVITENEAGNYGGGIGNSGTLIIKNTKLYNNKTLYAGADIGNAIGSTIDLQDSIEQLVELFKEDNIFPKGWICDYDFEQNLYIPDVDPSEENALLKLDFEYYQPEPDTPPILVDDNLIPDMGIEPEIPPVLVDDNLIPDMGVDAEVPPVLVDDSLIPDMGIESGVPSVLVDDGLIPDMGVESEAPPVLVDESLIPDMGITSSDNNDNSSTGSDDKNEPPVDESEQPEGSTPSNSQPPDQGLDETSPQYPSVSDSGNSSSSTDNSSRTNTTTDSSQRTTTSDSNNTSTVNNYYPQQPEAGSSNQPEVQTIVVPVGNAGSSEPIRIESNPAENTSGGTDGINLNINVNVGSDATDQQATVPIVQQSGASWYQVAIIALLFGILVCLLKKN